jgi:hypothetical protein
MPSEVVTATNTPAVGSGSPPGALVAAQITVKNHELKSIIIDNKQGASDHQVIIYDSFTPSITNGVASPVFTTEERFVMDVIMGDVESFNEEDLRGIRCIGALSVLADSVDTKCVITVGYESK